jgi:hypothetical protein
MNGNSNHIFLKTDLNGYSVHYDINANSFSPVATNGGSNIKMWGAISLTDTHMFGTFSDYLLKYNLTTKQIDIFKETSALVGTTGVKFTGFTSLTNNVLTLCDASSGYSNLGTCFQFNTTDLSIIKKLNDVMIPSPGKVSESADSNGNIYFIGKNVNSSSGYNYLVKLNLNTFDYSFLTNVDYYNVLQTNIIVINNDVYLTGKQTTAGTYDSIVKFDTKTNSWFDLIPQGLSYISSLSELSGNLYFFMKPKSTSDNNTYTTGSYTKLHKLQIKP